MSDRCTMRINLIRPIRIIIEPSTKKQWAIAIGIAMILAYMLGYMISKALIR